MVFLSQTAQKPGTRVAAPHNVFLEKGILKLSALSAGSLWWSAIFINHQEYGFLILSSTEDFFLASFGFFGRLCFKASMRDCSKNNILASKTW